MAEGIAKKIFGNLADIQSAGSNPSRVHPLAIEVMKEKGMDISQQKSKSIESIDTADMDWAITLCAEEICPYLGGRAQKQHWPFPNPTDGIFSKEEQLKKFRMIRDQLTQKIEAFKRSLEIKDKK